MIKKHVSALLITGTVIALLALQIAAQNTERAEQEKPKTSTRLSLIESIKRNVKRLGATVDDTKSSGEMVVSNYNDPRGGGKTTIVIVNDRRKNLLGFYIYNFGSLKNASNHEEIYKYLLSANDDITIGSFFVDKDSDIGYKYLVSNAQMATPSAFDTVYLAMATVARERRPEIKQLLGNASDKDEKPPERL